MASGRNPFYSCAARGRQLCNDSVEIVSDPLGDSREHFTVFMTTKRKFHIEMKNDFSKIVYNLITIT